MILNKMKYILLISLILLTTFQLSDSANKIDGPHHHHDNSSKYDPQNIKRAASKRPIDFDKLKEKISYDVVLKYFDFLKKAYKHVEILNIGETEKSRKKLKGVRITNSGKDQRNKDKPIILIIAGMDGSKHIHSTVALYAIFQLAEARQLNPSLVRLFDFVIIPVGNPEGYEAGVFHNTAAYACYYGACDGTNLLMNWEYFWQKNCRSDLCTGLGRFKGKSERSSSEAEFLKNTMQKYQEKTVLFIELTHTGKVITYPYAGDGRTIPNMPVRREIAKAAVKSMIQCNGTGTNYSVMSEFENNKKKNVYGAPMDFADNRVGIEYIFKLYLPETIPTAEGGQTSELQPRVYEAWCGVRDMCYETFIYISDKGAVSDKGGCSHLMSSFVNIFMFFIFTQL